MENVFVSAAISLTKTANGYMSAGGITGYSATPGTLKNLEYAGVLTFLKTNTSTGANYCGGIAGYITGSDLDTVRFSGSIVLPTGGSGGDYSANGTSIVGGLAGYGGADSSISGGYASGDIAVSRAGSGQFYLGGLVGELEGSSGSPAGLYDSTYENGDISYIAAGGGYSRTGGVVGSIMRYAEVSACHSRAGSVSAYHTATSSSTIMIGGFAGQAVQADISDCSSTAAVSVPAAHTGTAAIRIGGFAGQLGSLGGASASITDCYATGDVISYGAGSVHYTGGFFGYSYMNTADSNTAKVTLSCCYATGNVTAVNRYSSISAYAFATGGFAGLADATAIGECYATGAVSATGTAGTTVINAGGLVGYLGASVTTASYPGNEQMKSAITNSYALGNVFADKAAGDGAVNAGGLIGYANIAAGTPNPTYDSLNAGKIQYTFAAGNVTAQSAGSGAVYAGGVAGNIEAADTFANNAAVLRSGATERKITAKGGGSRNANRIFGVNTGATGAANYGLTSLYLGTDTSYYTYAPVYATATTDIGVAVKNGASYTSAEFRASATWTNGSGLNFGNTGLWNLGGVARGYPAISGLGGQ
jgi:hypothetical protein